MIHGYGVVYKHFSLNEKLQNMGALMITHKFNDADTVVFLASGQYTLSMRTYAPFRNVVRSNQRHDSGDEVKFK